MKRVARLGWQSHAVRFPNQPASSTPTLNPSWHIASSTAYLHLPCIQFMFPNPSTNNQLHQMLAATSNSLKSPSTDKPPRLPQRHRSPSSSKSNSRSSCSNSSRPYRPDLPPLVQDANSRNRSPSRRRWHSSHALILPQLYLAQIDPFFLTFFYTHPVVPTLLPLIYPCVQRIHSSSPCHDITL